MMKKILVVASLAALSVSAFAQSNLTIYGVADAAYQYTHGKDQTFSGVQSGGWSGSRLGFRGTEDLGNGLSAVFTMEFGTDLDSTVSTTRQAFVGMDSQYGMVTLGKQNAPSNVVMGRNNAFDISAGSAMGMVMTTVKDLGGTMTTNSAARWDNSVAYQSKTYNGFSGRVMYAFGEAGVDGGSNVNNRLGFGGSYVTGPLNIDAVFQQTNAVSTGTGRDIDEAYIGAGYDFTSFKLVGSYQELYNRNKNTSAIDVGVFSVGAIVPVTDLDKVRVEYVHASFDNNGNQPVPSNSVDGSSSGWTLGYTHDFSKRTMLYTTYAYMSNDDDSKAVGISKVGLAGESNQTFMVGMVHRF